jgi:DNA-binding CsgD family transcriptional regulator
MAMSEIISQEYSIPLRGAQALEAKAHGFSRNETAAIFGLSPETIHSALQAVYEELKIVGVGDPGALAITMAFYGGLFKPERDYNPPGTSFDSTMVASDSSFIVASPYHKESIVTQFKVPGSVRSAEEMRLTPAQRRVFRGTMLGFSVGQISRGLGSSPFTVKHHARAINDRLGVNNKYHAVARGLTLDAMLGQTSIVGFEAPMQQVGRLVTLSSPWIDRD